QTTSITYLSDTGCLEIQGASLRENKRNVHHQIMYDEFSTVYSNYLANNQTGVTRPTENTGEVITRWQRKSGFFDVSHNVFDNKAL
ncbi:hypothetical protein MLS40_02545, partial [Escherichia coli]|nr:hypothetical protein [Escherichia coli]MCN4776350.1 hypothetical protein [Escherichia coli]MCN5431365.1 hypothetical protein [Escherichia coli]